MVMIKNGVRSVFVHILVNTFYLAPIMKKSTTNSYELKTLGKFYQTTGMLRIPEHRIKRGFALRTHAAGIRTSSY